MEFDLARLEEARRDMAITVAANNVEARFGTILEDTAPEVLAIILVERMKITPLATPIMTYFVRRLHKFLKR